MDAKDVKSPGPSAVEKTSSSDKKKGLANESKINADSDPALVLRVCMKVLEECISSPDGAKDVSVLLSQLRHYGETRLMELMLVRDYPSDLNGCDGLWMTSCYLLNSNVGSKASWLKIEWMFKEFRLRMPVSVSPMAVLLSGNSTDVARYDSACEIALYLMRRIKLDIVSYHHMVKLPVTCAEQRAKRDAELDKSRARNTSAQYEYNRRQEAAKALAAGTAAGSGGSKSLNSPHPCSIQYLYEEHIPSEDSQSTASVCAKEITDEDLEIAMAYLLVTRCIEDPKYIPMCSTYFTWKRWEESFFGRFEPPPAEIVKGIETEIKQTRPLLCRWVHSKYAQQRDDSYKEEQLDFLYRMFMPLGCKMRRIAEQGSAERCVDRSYALMTKHLDSLFDVTGRDKILGQTVTDMLGSWQTPEEYRKAYANPQLIHYEFDAFFRVCWFLSDAIQREVFIQKGRPAIMPYVILPDDVYHYANSLLSRFQPGMKTVRWRPRIVFYRKRVCLLFEGKYIVKVKTMLDAVCAWLFLSNSRFNGLTESGVLIQSVYEEIQQIANN